MGCESRGFRGRGGREKLREAVREEESEGGVRDRAVFGSRGVAWEVRYIPFGLPVVAMELESPTVMLIGWLMPSVAGSKAKID